MKLSPQELAQYYQSLGIDRSLLLSPRALDLSELPPGTSLSEAVKSDILGILELWNGMDDLTKIDAAWAEERRVLRGRDPHDLQTANAWSAYLLLGRIRGCEQRREVMRRIACGELTAAALRHRKPGRPARH